MRYRTSRLQAWTSTFRWFLRCQKPKHKAVTGMKIYRPLWNEGALLSPQQFQQQSEWESFRSAGVSALTSPFPWGVEKVAFDDGLLASGLIQLSQLRLWLEDGSLIDTQSSDLPPVPRELHPAQLAGLEAVTVVIALPLMQSGMTNVQQDTVMSDRPLRYREEWVTVGMLSALKKSRWPLPASTCPSVLL